MALPGSKSRWLLEEFAIAHVKSARDVIQLSQSPSSAPRHSATASVTLPDGVPAEKILQRNERRRNVGVKQIARSQYSGFVQKRGV